MNIKYKTHGKTAHEKLGLALSGGGFRASFFHIGVLAQMATLGLLRNVEVISTVSGGSIIGALYYLHVKKLLEEKSDDDITDQDFVEMIRKIEKDFFHAVQRNIRMSTFSNPLKNFRMSKANYSRSDRIGELYDRFLYRHVIDSRRKKPIEMRELKIRPDGKDFYPRTDNAKRKTKVPILLINATTLNTGHNWRFEATHMGSPDRDDKVSLEIDKNLRLQKIASYDEIIPKQQNMDLGSAVAASACVPGIFHPLAVSDLYAEKTRVQLVDGGVHDNQGIQGLLDEECTKLIVSDASGQMKDIRDPATGVLSVLFRTNSIFMDRVREEQIYGLIQQYRSNVAFIHLRKGLPVKKVSWINAKGKPFGGNESEATYINRPEDFGVHEKVQDLLSQIRTDLDSFTEIESHSLMSDGYLMSREEFGKTEGLKIMMTQKKIARTPEWDFLQILPWMSRPTPKYEKHLEVGSQRLFKPFRLSFWLLLITLVFAVSSIVLFGCLMNDKISALLSTSYTLKQIFIALLVLLAGFIPILSRMFKILRLIRRPSEFILRLIIRGLLPALGSLFVNIHLWIFNPVFIQIGKLKQLKGVVS